jgi:hypothetical protein
MTDTITGASEIEKKFPRPDTDDPVRIYSWEMEKDWESHRDQWGRPEVKLPNSRQRRGYRRASSFGSPGESDYLLALWKLRQVLLGATRSQALRLEVTRAERKLLDTNPKIVAEGKKELNALAEKAMEVVGSSDKATIGTALHDVLEHVDLERDPGFIPEEFRPDVRAYEIASECFETVSSERIVVEDTHKIGGRYDRCVRLRRAMQTHTGFVIDQGEVIIGDVKTSQSMDFAGCKFGVQCWAYANGVPYDPITEERYGWAPPKDADDAAKALWATRYGMAHEPPRTDWAVIMHVPSGQGIARLYWVDLEHYGKAIKDIERTYFWRNSGGKKGFGAMQSFEDYALTAKHARSLGDLQEAYGRAVANDAWTPDLKEIFAARKLALSPPEPEPADAVLDEPEPDDADEQVPA